MANVITMPNQAPDTIMRMIESFNQRRSQKEQVGVQQQNADTERTRVANEQAFQTGQLANQARPYDESRYKSEADSIVQQLHDMADAAAVATDPSAQQQAHQKMQEYATQLQARPDWNTLKPYVGTAISGRVMTAERQSKLNSDVTARDQTGRAAAGGTDPNDIAMASKIGPAQSFPTTDMFKQSQAKDLQRRTTVQGPSPSGAPIAAPGPNLNSAVPRPSGNAVSDYEARETGAMSTAPQNLTAQTDITTTGMREAGATKRAKIAADVKDGMVPGTGQFSPAVIAAGDDVMRGNDIMRVPRDSRMAVFQYVAAKGGRAVPAEVAKQVRGQIAAEVALEEISKAMDGFTAEKSSVGNAQNLYRKGVDFRSALMKSVPLVARGLGHTGVLTQQDVDSVIESITGLSGIAGLANVKALPSDAKARVQGLLRQFGTIQQDLLQDLIPQGTVQDNGQGAGGSGGGVRGAGPLSPGEAWAHAFANRTNMSGAH